MLYTKDISELYVNQIPTLTPEQVGEIKSYTPKQYNSLQVNSSEEYISPLAQSHVLLTGPSAAKVFQDTIRENMLNVKLTDLANGPIEPLKLIKSIPFLTKKQQIWVTFSREGIHRYPAALSDKNLATGDEYDVSFLGYPHRHTFNFKVWISVTHSDRDIEFIQFKRWLNSLYSEGTLQLDYKSCEMIADELYQKIAEKYPGREIKIQIDEDGENGCEITYETLKQS